MYLMKPYNLETFFFSNVFLRYLAGFFYLLCIYIYIYIYIYIILNRTNLKRIAKLL